MFWDDQPCVNADLQTDVSKNFSVSILRADVASTLMMETESS
jgi:hypothetical protein